MTKQEKLNNIKRSDIANCIILHDFAIEKPDFKKWTEYVTSFFREYNIEPSKISSPSKTNNKLIDFKRGLQNHEKINYEVTAIEIDALPLNYGTMMFDKIFGAIIDVEKSSCSFSTLVFDSEIVKFNATIMDKITSDLAELTGARYGYIFQREFSKVVGYEYGIISGDIDDNEEDQIDKWGKEYSMPDGSYKTGDLRDIYRINILSQEHLDRIVMGKGLFSRTKKLSDWIASNKKRGELVPLCKDRWSWYVEPNNIEYVRESLRHTGIVLCI